MKRINRIKNSIIKLGLALSERLGLIKHQDAKTSRFLVVCTTGIGDTLWGTPAIRALRTAFPEGYISVLTNPIGLQVLKGNPDIDDIFVFKRHLRGYLAIPGLLKRLKNRNFDTVFIFHASDRIIWPLCAFTGAKRIIGVNGQSKGLDFILTTAIRQDNIHGIETRLRLVREVAKGESRKTISFYLTEGDRKGASMLLEETGVHGDSLIIGLHPGAQKTYKQWPLRNFIETGNRLMKDLGCRIVVTGDSKEKILCEELASKVTGAVSVAGRTSLRETAAIIERMSLFITNDTGPMHIAFALGTPTVALFCPTDPELCGPYHAKNAVVIKKPVICTPCTGKNCSTPVCMEQITVEEVINAAESLIPRSLRTFRMTVRGGVR